MLTMIVAYVLISLSTGQAIHQFPSIDQCVMASYQVSFATGQETRCEPVYRRVAR